ncbi:transcription termination factor MTERF9, chloroplastic-like [Beta vulgaris subsp. vulgaris]|uniref:transcription termination factor MTERF9, chloroplastic-like n=1 Tax=Beta vulgaris subsp. vulgaris TaxID=3555 RepID=UPI0020376737|nr:transcription termination factor MTERF9, chloroplastic-like [Beta vulgaris subsp. vulgaris]
MVPSNGSRFLYFLLSTSHCQRLPSTLLYSTLRSLNLTSTSTKEGLILVSAVSRNPQLITHHLGPAINAFRTVLGSDENVVSVLKRTRRRRLSLKKAAEFLVPNVTLLPDDYGIPCDKIQKYIVQQSNPFIERTDVFRDMLIRVEEELGITRYSTMFVYGIHLVAYYTKEQLEDKFRIFRSFGWAQSDVTALIKRHPMCLTSTEARIKERLDFLMNEMGYKPNYLTSKPCLFIYGVNKRLLPRYKVLQTLKEKGHVRMDYSLSTATCFSDPAFLKSSEG